MPPNVNLAGRAAISFGLFNATHSMAAFADPVASIKTDRAFAMTCGVIVKRLKGGLGPVMGMTRRLRSWSEALLGNSDAI